MCSCCNLQLTFNPQCDNLWTIDQSVNISSYCSCSTFAFSHLVLVASVQSNSVVVVLHFDIPQQLLTPSSPGFFQNFAQAHLESSTCHHPCDRIEDGVMKLKVCVAVNHTSLCYGVGHLTWLPMFFCLVVTLTLSCHLFIPPYLSQFWMLILTRPFLDSGQ